MSTGVFDDTDSWVLMKNNIEVIRVSKDGNPFWPLSAVLKWGAKPVDIDFLNALSNEFNKECDKREALEYSDESEDAIEQEN